MTVVFHAQKVFRQSDDKQPKNNEATIEISFNRQN